MASARAFSPCATRARAVSTSTARATSGMAGMSSTAMGAAQANKRGTATSSVTTRWGRVRSSPRGEGWATVIPIGLAVLLGGSCNGQTGAPTAVPTLFPTTGKPTPSSSAPTTPTEAPTLAPTATPTPFPTGVPTDAPTSTPTGSPTIAVCSYSALNKIENPQFDDDYIYYYGEGYYYEGGVPERERRTAPLWPAPINPQTAGFYQQTGCCRFVLLPFFKHRVFFPMSRVFVSAESGTVTLMQSFVFSHTCSHPCRLPCRLHWMHTQRDSEFRLFPRVRHREQRNR